MKLATRVKAPYKLSLDQGHAIRRNRGHVDGSFSGPWVIVRDAPCQCDQHDAKHGQSERWSGGCERPVFPFRGEDFDMAGLLRCRGAGLF